MTKTITLPDDLYAQLAALARPFQDKEAADVIRRLIAGSEKVQLLAAPNSDKLNALQQSIDGRAPRERGAVIDLDGTKIKAHTVPDLCGQVFDHLHSKGHAKALAELSPYSTSAKRYLYAKTPLHPNGNDFVAPIKNHSFYVETHKNYKTAITQLARLSTKLGVTLAYEGN